MGDSREREVEASRGSRPAFDAVHSTGTTVPAPFDTEHASVCAVPTLDSTRARHASFRPACTEHPTFDRKSHQASAGKGLPFKTVGFSADSAATGPTSNCTQSTPTEIEQRFCYSPRQFDYRRYCNTNLMTGTKRVRRFYIVPILQAEPPGPTANDGRFLHANGQRQCQIIIAVSFVIV